LLIVLTFRTRLKEKQAKGRPDGVPSDLLDGCREMRGDWSREGVVLILEALPKS